MHRPFFIMSIAALTAASTPPAQAAPKPAAPKPAKPAIAAPKPGAKPPANTVKGQGQLAGLNGQFGTIYSTKDGFNISIVSARYDINAAPTYSQLYPVANEKLLVIDFALKNASPNDNWFGSLGLFTAVDQAGQLYQMGDSDVVQKSQGTKTSLNLRPGQGLGQAGTADPIEAVLKVPASARIVKIMLNRERLNSTEKTIRYYIAGATKAEAGENGDPKNVIAPLPDAVRDPADASGAIALAEGKGTIGKPLVTRFLELTVNSVEVAPDGTKVDNNAPEDGKKFIVANVTVSAPADANGATPVGAFDWPAGNDSAPAQLVDADGEKYAALASRKAKRDEALADGTGLKGGESYTYRIFWAVPKDAALKKLLLGASGARVWAIDVSTVK